MNKPSPKARNARSITGFILICLTAPIWGVMILLGLLAIGWVWALGRLAGWSRHDRPLTVRQVFVARPVPQSAPESVSERPSMH